MQLKSMLLTAILLSTMFGVSDSAFADGTNAQDGAVIHPVPEDTFISTRADLEKALADSSTSNPLSMLSQEAKKRLLDTLIVNRQGKITSFWIADILQELPPADAKRALALFEEQ